MKKHRGLLIFFAVILVCLIGIRTIFKATSQYPDIGDAVSYPVEQVAGFELSIEKPSFSPFKGYTIKWTVTADSEDVYYFIQDGKAPNTFEYLERNIDGQWYRLRYLQDNFPITTIEFAVGGEESSRLEGSIVQKYAYYGTRLEPGTYRIVLEMHSKDGTPYYLAHEFDI